MNGKTSAAHTSDGVDERLMLARQLVAAFDAGDEEGANGVLDGLLVVRERTLFGNLGRLTRGVHQAMQDLDLGARVAQLAGEAPDAQRRLSHVVAMTERAAHQTLAALERSLLVARELGAEAATLRQSLAASPAVEIRTAWKRRLDAFLGQVQEQLAVVQRTLTEAVVAQEYQDLTGQAIQQVTSLIERVEGELVALMREVGAKSVQPPTGEKDARVANQDEVDALLSSLGF